MKSLGMAVAMVALTGAVSFAQERSAQDPGRYVSAFGGAVWSAGNSTGSVVFEGGVRVAAHVMAFGSVGRFEILQGVLPPTLDAPTATLAHQGLDVTGGGTLRAWYGLAGVRAEIPASRHAVPYLLAGIGAARLNPAAQFTFASGDMPDGSTPQTGTDVTSALVSAGSYTQPAASNSAMFMFGGGVQVPVVPHWAADIGYRYSRFGADSMLTASPLNTNAITFGVGYRF
jgi:opacity protein-like surface antigen